MYQNALDQFNSMHMQYAETFKTNPNRTGLIRSASTSCALINGFDQPRAPPRRRKRGESLDSQKLDSANSSQYSLVMNLNYELDPNMINQPTSNKPHQSNAWTPNSTLRRYLSSDMANTNYNRPMNIKNNLSNNFNSFNEQFQNKQIGVLDQIMNRTIPTPPPRLSSAKNTLRRRSYVENLINQQNITGKPAKPIRQKLQTGLNQSQFDIPNTPITTHLPPQAINRFSTLTRPSTTLSSINLTQTNMLNQSPTPTTAITPQPQQIFPNQQFPNQTNRSASLDYQIQPFYNKTMSLDNLNAIALKQNLRRSPTREELFDYIVAQQEQLSELKTQQKVLEKQVDIAHKEASKAHHHHHHKHRHHKSNRSKERENLDNSIDSSSMISSERRSRNHHHHHRSKYDKNLTKEANKQVHDHIKQLQEQLELIREKRRKIKTDKNLDEDLDQIDQALDKSIDRSILINLTKERKDLIDNIKNMKDRHQTSSIINDSTNLLKAPSSRQELKENDTNHLINNDTDLHANLLSPMLTSLSNTQSPLGSRSSSIERAIAKRELLKESAKDKWNKSFMEDLTEEQLIKELSKSSMNQDLLKELLPKISINTDDKNREMLNYNEILEKNLKLNQAQNWLTDPLDEYTYSEQKSPNEPISPFGGRTGVFRPISSDSSSLISPNKDKLSNDLLTGESSSNFTFPNLNQMKPSIDRKETSSPIPSSYFEQQNQQQQNIENFIAKRENNLITGNIDLMSNLMNSNRAEEMNLLKRQEDKLIDRLENELRNEKIKQKELIEKRQAIEQKQLEHELELEKTKHQLIEQQNLFQEQQHLLQNQRQEIQIERWRMEQEKNQLEMKVKREQFEQQKLLNQQLEQQRKTFEQQLQAQKQLQDQLQKELEYQRQQQQQQRQQQHQQQQDQLKKELEYQRQQQQQQQQQHQQQQAQLNLQLNKQLNQVSSLNPIQSPPAMSQQTSFFDNNSPSTNFFNNQPTQTSNILQQNLPNTSSSMHLLNNKKSPLTSPLQSLQSLLPQSLQPKSLQNQIQQSVNQLTNQFKTEPSKPRRHRLGQDEPALTQFNQSNQYSAFKPPMHSNSKLNLMVDSPKSSMTALTTPFISTEQRAPSPRPPFTATNPGMLSSTSSLTRQQPVGLMDSFSNQQQLINNRRSQENLNRSRPNFFGSNEKFDHRLQQQQQQSNQYFGSKGNLNKMDINYPNKNLSTGSLHLNQSPISGQNVPINSRSNFRGGNYQYDQYDQRQYSSQTNLNATNNPHLINGPRRNSVIDPFRDHFDQYFSTKKPISPNNLKSNAASTVHHKISNTDLTTTANNLNVNTAGGLTTSNEITHSSLVSLQPQPIAINRTELRSLTPIPIISDASVSNPLDKLNQTKELSSSLNEYQGNRRLTLPELPRIDTSSKTATDQQVKGYSIEKVQVNDLNANSLNRRKNSLPDNVKSAAATIKPGWNREEVSVLAHEARELKRNAAEMNATQVTILKIKDFISSNLFIISLIIFNLSVFYVYLQLLEPID